MLDPMSRDLATLYRPVGQAELDLIRAAGLREFPPRLPAQPFFYPAADLPSFNGNLAGPIEVISEFRANRSSQDPTA